MKLFISKLGNKYDHKQERNGGFETCQMNSNVGWKT